MSIQQNFPAISPSLSLNFARSKTLDPRITFTRTSTATRVNGQGLIEVVGADTPRFDHKYENGVVKSLGLLVEEARTNSLYYSNDFSQNPPVGALQGWLKQNSHPVPTQSVVGPDGVSNSGWRFYRTATNQYIYQQVAGAGTHTLSAWVRSSAATGSFTMQGYNGTDAGMSQQFTATNEWKRFSITISPTTTTNYYPCIPTNINTDFYVWGAQLELNGSFPTSYIPTSGSTVTRTPDNVSMVGDNFSSWYNQSEGTFFARHKVGVGRTSGGSHVYSADFNFQNRISAQYAFNGEENLNRFRSFVRYTGTIFGDFSPDDSAIEGIFHKTSHSYSITNTTQYLNGSIVGVGITPTGLPVPIRFEIGKYMEIYDYLNGHISQLTYYPRRLSNDNLQNLTK